MTEFYFYQLADQTPQAAIAQLCERALAANWRISIRAEEAFQPILSEALWTTNPNSFLAHDMGGDPRLAPIHISNTAPSEAQCCFTYGPFDIFDGAHDPLVRHCLMFSSEQETLLTHARTCWKEVTSKGLIAKYYAQEAGSWTLKAQSGD